MAVEGTLESGQRRVVYGLNVVLAGVLALFVLALAIWAADRFGGQVDLSSQGVNSLSPRTKQLLKGVGEQITLTGLYTVALKEVRPHAEKHRNRVQDLLDLYEVAGGGKVAARMIDPQDQPAEVDALLARLREKPRYRDESKDHAAIVAEFPALNQTLVELLQSEVKQIEELARADQRMNTSRELVIVVRSIRDALEDARVTQEDVAALQTEGLPRFGRAVESIRKMLTNVRGALQTSQEWMSQQVARDAELPESAKAVFAGVKDRYASALSTIDEALARTQNLKEVEFDEVYETLKSGQSVVVETTNEAKVIPHAEIWSVRMRRDAPPAPDGDPAEFTGEQAISSSLLQLTQKEKTAVVFVRFGGGPLLVPDFSQLNQFSRELPEAPMQQLNALMKSENFETAEWDVSTQATPPTVENAARTIYVVTPPAPPEQANPMQPPRTPPMSPQQKQAVIDAVTASGRAMFLAGWRPPAMPFGPGEDYAYSEYLKSNWGIEVRSSFLTVEFARHPQRTEVWIPVNRNPTLLPSTSLRTEAHPISEPLASLPYGFSAAAPLVVSDALPTGVSVAPLISVQASEDVWAFSNLMRVQQDLSGADGGTRRYEDDLPSPYPVALAAQDAQQRQLVVFGSEQFMADEVANMGQLVMIGGSLQLAQIFPGNTELFINALHWLSGDSQRIAIGPGRSGVPRLDRLREGFWNDFTKVLLVGIWPTAALLLGAVVWFVRRT